MTQIKSSLYESLGADVGIRQVVDHFYDRVLADEMLAPYFRSASVPELRRHQVEFLSAATGGPRRYSGPALADAHAHLNVSDAAFDRVVVHLIGSLDHFDVDPGTVDEVVAALAPLKSDIVAD